MCLTRVFSVSELAAEPPTTAAADPAAAAAVHAAVSDRGRFSVAPPSPALLAEPGKHSSTVAPACIMAKERASIYFVIKA